MRKRYLNQAKAKGANSTRDVLFPPALFLLMTAVAPPSPPRVYPVVSGRQLRGLAGQSQLGGNGFDGFGEERRISIS